MTRSELLQDTLNAQWEREKDFDEGRRVCDLKSLEDLSPEARALTRALDLMEKALLPRDEVPQLDNSEPHDL